VMEMQILGGLARLVVFVFLRGSNLANSMCQVYSLWHTELCNAPLSCCIADSRRNMWLQSQEPLQTHC